MSVALWTNRLPSTTRGHGCRSGSARSTARTPTEPACLICRNSGSSRRGPPTAPSTPASRRCRRRPPGGRGRRARTGPAGGAARRAGSLVGGEQLLREAVVAMLPDRRVLGDPQVPVAVLGELLERPAVAALARLALDVGGAADLVGFGEHAEELVDGDQVVPDVEPADAGVPGHPLPVGAQAGRNRALCVHAIGAGEDHDAGHQPSDVPFERAGQRLIEVPQVERQVPFRGGPQSEVEQVRVAAELHDQPTVWTGPQIRRHDRGGSAVVGPRSGRHPAVADRQQLLGADRVLRQ